MTRKSLGGVVRNARQRLGLTQRAVAARVGVKPSHIAYIEGGRRRPSFVLLRRLADTLQLDRRELLLLAHPEARWLMGRLDESAKRPADAWVRFASNKLLLKQHNVSRTELRLLKQVSLLEHVSSPRHFLFILNSIRQAATPDD
jgi:transcriptional regulator with XRE-family HTH domain